MDQGDCSEVIRGGQSLHFCPRLQYQDLLMDWMCGIRQENKNVQSLWPENLGIAKEVDLEREEVRI